VTLSPLITPFLDLWVGEGNLRKQVLQRLASSYGTSKDWPSGHPHTLFIRGRGHPCDVEHLSNMVADCTASFPGCKHIRMTLQDWRRQIPTTMLNSSVVLTQYNGSKESMIEAFSRLMQTSSYMLARHYNKSRHDIQADHARDVIGQEYLAMNPDGSFIH
jgi:hypothetical protein